MKPLFDIKNRRNTLSSLPLTLLAAATKGFYGDNPVQTETLSILSGANHYNHWIMNKVRSHIQGNVLEVGCGVGNFSQSILDLEAVTALTAVDIVVDYAEQTEARVVVPSGKGFDVKAMNLFDPTDQNTDLNAVHREFDTIILLNVLEHLENDRQALKTLSGYLKPGGKLVILVPAQPWLMSHYDIAIGHYRRYTKHSLHSLVQSVGQFNVQVLQNFNLLGILGWLWNFKIRQKRAFNNAHVGLFNHIAPFLQWIESKVSVPIGLSVLSVVQKA